MLDIKLLIDTNIIIGLEDAGEIQASFADLIRKSAENDIHVFVHEASKKDIERDKDLARRAATLSKIKKFALLENVAIPSNDELRRDFGEIPKPNDLVDAILLAAVQSNIVDLLVTEDDGLHRRAKRAGLANRVLTVSECLTWIKQTYESHRVDLPAVESTKAYGLSQNDPIFNELRADYNGFDDWLAKCRREHRECWVIRDAADIAALIIRNDETQKEAGTKHSGRKIMKICTLKVSERHQGKKYGEQLLKQVIWYAQRNRYDLLYLTVFPKQSALIRLLEEYGFQRESIRPNGEWVFEKPLGHGPVGITADSSILDADRRHYPRFIDADAVRKFVIPIRGQYHRKLFPEVGPELAHATDRPGNTIRKVYLCRAMSEGLEPGAMLFFYLSKGPEFGSQSITRAFST